MPGGIGRDCLYDVLASGSLLICCLQKKVDLASVSAF